MTPILWAALGVTAWLGTLLAWVFVVFRRDAHREAARMGTALTPFDPIATAGGAAGKSYTGGFGREVYFIPDETAVEPTRAEWLP